MIARSALAFVVTLCACGGYGTTVGDRRCADDTECRDGERCVTVMNVLVSTGDCLASSGASVCRKVCESPADARPCGCQ